jgi:hypothetical protein
VADKVPEGVGTNLIGNDRPIRVCDTCGLVDDHPKHVAQHYSQAEATIILKTANRTDLPEEVKKQALAELVDAGTMTRHMDCCRAQGCPDGSCDTLVDKGKDHLRGAELVELLESGQMEEPMLQRARLANQVSTVMDPAAVVLLNPVADKPTEEDGQ